MAHCGNKDWRKLVGAEILRQTANRNSHVIRVQLQTNPPTLAIVKMPVNEILNYRDGTIYAPKWLVLDRNKTLKAPILTAVVPYGNFTEELG